MKVPESKCPACGEKLDAVTEMTEGEQTMPKTGDISMCGECGVVLEFDGQLGVRAMSTDEVLGLEPEVKRMIVAARKVLARKRSKTDERSKEYEWQINQMLARGRVWLGEHQGVSFKVQFNYSSHVNIVAPISNAFIAHWVSADENGLKLVKALWPWDDEKEPTVAMVRYVMDELMNYGKFEKD